MKKTISIDLQNDSITDLTIDELNRLKQIVSTSISLYKKSLKKKKPIQGTLFGSIETNSEIKTTFEKSNVYNWSVFEKELLDIEQMGVDINFYYNSVKDWSLKNTSVRRTARGWIATARGFIRTAVENKKVVMIDNLPKESTVLTDAMLAYLNM